VAAVSGDGGVGGAADLEILHALKKSEELLGERILVEAALLEGEQELVGGFEGGEAAFLRLLFDHEAAGAEGVNMMRGGVAGSG
jgi:hypothetical protein